MNKRCAVGMAVLLGWLGAPSARAQETMKFPMINSERKEVGEVILNETPNGLLITLNLRDRAPGITRGAHAFHIHEIGKCEPPFESAGEHYNPQKHKHGFLVKNGRHVGDLPNIHVPQQGALTQEFFVPGVGLRAGQARLMDEDGSALVIHAKPDDYKSDPAGNAGDRIACAVIGPGR